MKPTRKYPRWTAADDDHMRTHYPSSQTADVAAHLGRTVRAVYMRARTLGLCKSAQFLETAAPYRPWTAQDDALLRALYPHHKTADIAPRLGRSAGATHQRARQLGLGKSDAFFADIHSGRLHAAQTDPRMIATRFQKGLTPWNKGKAWGDQHPNSVATRFKKGQRSHTEMPLGSYRINTSKGYPRLERKMSETPGPNHLRWAPVARLVWEAAHGPVPAGYIVIFKRADLVTTELEHITLDRLECISRTENARRNHPSNLNPALHKLYQLKGAITRQVNRIAREHASHTKDATT